MQRFTSWRSVHAWNHPWHGLVSTRHPLEKPHMIRTRGIAAAALCTSLLSGCEIGPRPPTVRPAAFTALGVTAAYLNGDVVGGTRSRAAKMRAARIGPL